MKKGLIPFTFLKPTELLKEPGDKITMEVTKTGKKVGKIRTKELKMSQVTHKSGSTVTYLMNK